MDLTIITEQYLGTNTGTFLSHKQQNHEINVVSK